jgi:hypothetical protein
LAELPTATFVASDSLALGALQVLREYWRHMSDDVAVVDLADFHQAWEVVPPVTTVRFLQPKSADVRPTRFSRLLWSSPDSVESVVLAAGLARHSAS